MLILGIDGSLARPGVAVAEKGLVLASRSAGSSGKPSRDILTMLTGALEELSISINDIGLIAVATGPGSFTGVRAAMATAAGLAQAIGASIAGVGTLACLAKSAPPGADEVVAVSGARKGMVYAARYKFAEGEPSQITSPLETPASSLAYWEGDPLLLIGEGFEMESAYILEQSAGRARILQPAMPVAAAGALIAWRRMEKGDLSARSPRPEYVGLAQAVAAKGGSIQHKPQSGGENDRQIR